MQRKQFRHRHKPYRLLCEILWGHFAWLTWENGNTFTIQTGPMSRRLRVPNDKVREYFQYLQRHRFISRLEYGRGWVKATVNRPSYCSFPSDLDTK